MSESVETIRSTSVSNPVMPAEKKNTPPAPQRDRVPKHPLFGVVSCASTSRKEYDIKGGGKGTTAIVATVPYGKLSLEVNIGAKYDPSKGLLQVEASAPRGVKFESEALADEMLAHVERSVAAWVGYNDAIDAAQRKIEAAYGVKPAKGDAARPRLVRTVKMAVGATAKES